MIIQKPSLSMYHLTSFIGLQPLFTFYLPLGIEEHLGIASALELHCTEDIEAEGLRRGVTALLEVSLAMGEGVAVTAFTCCNSTSGVSIN